MFVSEIQWDNGTCKQAEERLALCVRPSSCCDICIEHFWCPGAQNSYGSMIVGVQSDSEYNINMLHFHSVHEGTDRKPPVLLLEPDLLWIQKEGNDLLETQWPRNPLISFNLCYFSIFANHLVWKWWCKKKGKEGNP